MIGSLIRAWMAGSVRLWLELRGGCASSPAMRPPRWIALVLAVVLVSGHAAGLQLIAWTGMAIERAQTMSVMDAVCSALDGSRPCTICTAVDVLTASTDKPQAPSSIVVKPDLAPAVDLLFRLPAIEPVALSFVDSMRPLPSWRADVPTPPPQGS